MANQPLSEVVVYLIILNIAGLVSKVVWDWLANKRKESMGIPCDPKVYGLICPHHDRHDKKIIELERSQNKIQAQATRQETILAERTSEISRKLADHNVELIEIKDMVTKIDKNLAVYMSKVNGNGNKQTQQRRRTDGVVR